MCVPLGRRAIDGKTTVGKAEANGLLSRAAGGSVFHTFDPQGNVVQRLKSSAAVLSTHLFDAFGMWAGSAPSGPFGYKGQRGYYTDSETGLLLLASRYLNARTERFVTRAAISEAVGQTGGIADLDNRSPSDRVPLGGSRLERREVTTHRRGTRRTESAKADFVPLLPRFQPPGVRLPRSAIPPRPNPHRDASSGPPRPRL